MYYVRTKPGVPSSYTVMRTLIADLRYALRTIAKSPGFAFISILSIALGVGANAAMFSYVDALLLRPLPVPDSGRIVAINSTAPGTRLGNMSYPDYADLRDQTQTLSSLVCYEIIRVGLNTSRDGVAQMTLGAIASGNFFAGLGIDIAMGRSFRADEDRTPGKDLVAVISYRLWERQFGSDPAAVGRTLRLNGTDFTVVGVAPKDFSGPEAFIQPDVYVPMNTFAQAIPDAKSDYLTRRPARSLNLLGRLKSGVSAKQAQAELGTLALRLASHYPDTNRDRGVTVMNYQQARFQANSLDAVLALTLLGITGLVLLIACANVANLVLARGSARVKEIAIRMAIGAGRWRLVRQMLTESLLLAIAGGIAGLGVGYAGVRFLGSITPPADFPIELGVRMDTRLLVFSLALSIVTGIVFGLVPALRSTRSDLGSTIKSSDQGPGRAGFWRGRLSGRNVLVTVQLTLSVVLLIAAGFFMRGFAAAQILDPGFRIDHTLTVAFDPGLVRYNQEKARLFYRTLVDRVGGLGGVTEASLGHSVPFAANTNSRRVIVDGYQARPGEDNPSAWANIVDENYFSLMETPILRGRAFEKRDTATSPRVAIVNETLAQRAWPNRDAVGQRLQLDGPNGPTVQVVGVAKTGKYLYWAEPPQAHLWTPFTQDYDSQMTLHVRTAGDPAAMAAVVRNEVRGIDPDMPIFSVRTMEAFYSGRAMLGPRLLAQMVTAIGLTGLLLAIIGLYGVVAYAVSRRTREIGIRMAVGARPNDVLRMVLGQGLVFTVIGLAFGLAGALGIMRFLVNFSVGVSPHDPITFVSVPVILATVMMAACWFPARRAARVDPTLALRQE